MLNMHIYKFTLSWWHLQKLEIFPSWSEVILYGITLYDLSVELFVTNDEQDKQKYDE